MTLRSPAAPNAQQVVPRETVFAVLGGDTWAQHLLEEGHKKGRHRGVRQSDDNHDVLGRNDAVSRFDQGLGQMTGFEVRLCAESESRGAPPRSAFTDVRTRQHLGVSASVAAATPALLQAASQPITHSLLLRARWSCCRCHFGTTSFAGQPRGGSRRRQSCRASQRTRRLMVKCMRAA